MHFPESLRVKWLLIATGVLVSCSTGAGNGAGHPGSGDALPRIVGPLSPLSPLSPVQAADTLAPSTRWWSHLYGAAFYDTRWKGCFIQSYAQQGYGLVPGNALSVYGIGWLTADTRSTGAGPAPVIISDNVLVVGAGLRYRPLQGFWIDVQEGIAIDLIDRNGVSGTRGDFRAVATAGTGIYPEFLVHDGLKSPMSLLADFFISAGYYSRYKNGIGYAQGRLGVRAAEISRAFMDIYLRADAALDTEGKFYNNLFEIGPGLRMTPDPEWGLFFMVEYHHGIYADYTSAMTAEREAFYPSTYNTVRFLIVLDREF
jgi:hypothetical protein